MSLYRLLTGLALLAAVPTHAQGTVWKCMGEDGRAQYTNVQADTKSKSRKCTVVSQEVSVVPAQRPSATPSNFPRVDRETQRSRDDSRRKILEDELSAEQTLLTEAKGKLAEQENVREGGERNYQRVLDRLAPYKETVGQHEKNVQALQKEIDSLR